MSRSVPTLQLELRPSRLERTLIATVCVLALLAAWWNALPTPMRVGAVMIVLVLAGWCWRHSRGSAPARLAIAADGYLEWFDAAGRASPGELRGAVQVAGMVVLHLELRESGVRRLVMYPDNLDAADWRELRVMLKHGWRPEPPGVSGPS